MLGLRRRLLHARGAGIKTTIMTIATMIQSTVPKTNGAAFALGVGVGAEVGATVGTGVGAAVGTGVGDEAGVGVGVAVGAAFTVTEAAVELTAAGALALSVT